MEQAVKSKYWSKGRVGIHTVITQFQGLNIYMLISLGLVLCVYIFSLTFLPKHVFWSPDEGIRFIMARTGFSDGYAAAQLPYPGKVLDPLYQYFPSVLNPSSPVMYPSPRADGTVRFPWPIWFSLASGRLFERFGISGIYILPILGGLLVALLSGLIMNLYYPSLSPWVILAVGLGTPIYFYSVVFWDHTLAIFCALSALWVILLNRLVGWKSLIIGTTLILIASMFRIEMLLFGLALGLACGITLYVCDLQLIAPRQSTPGLSRTEMVPRFLILLLPLFIILLVVIVMNQQGLWFMPSRYITEINTRYASLSVQFHLNNLQRLIGDYLNFVPRLLINFPDYESPNLPMPYVWAGLLALLMCTIAAFIKDRRFETALLIPGLLVLAGLSLRVVLEPSPYRALHGILLSTPAIIMAVYAWPHAWRKRHPQLLLMLFSVLFFSVLGIGTIFLLRGGGHNGFSPGLEWGARYLLVLYPILMILSFIALKIYWQSSRPLLVRQIVIGILVFMLLLGLQFQIRGIWMLYSTKRTLVEWNTHLLSRPSQPVATDVWWLPASLATFFTTNEMYTIQSGESFEQWIKLIRDRGDVGFTFVTMNPWSPVPTGDPAVQVVPVNQEMIAGLYFVYMEISCPP